MDFLDSRTKKCEIEAQRIIHLKQNANQLPCAFTDTIRFTKSYNPTKNVPIKIDVPKGQLANANEFKARLKCSRPPSSKDKNFQKKRELVNGKIVKSKINH